MNLLKATKKRVNFVDLDRFLDGRHRQPARSHRAIYLKEFLVIHKIQNNIQITHDELNLLERMFFEGNLGTKEDYIREYGRMPLGQFVRSLLGLDKAAANQLFSEFIHPDYR